MAIHDGSLVQPPIDSIDTTPIAAIRAHAYKIPTDAPEADGTFAWTSTTLVVVEIDAGGCTGLGYTYTDASAVPLIRGCKWRPDRQRRFAVCRLLRR